MSFRNQLLGQSVGPAELRVPAQPQGDGGDEYHQNNQNQIFLPNFHGIDSSFYSTWRARSSSLEYFSSTLNTTTVKRPSAMAKGIWVRAKMERYSAKLP